MWNCCWNENLQGQITRIKTCTSATLSTIHLLLPDLGSSPSCRLLKERNKVPGE
jgi:hypothetical protein